MALIRVTIPMVGITDGTIGSQQRLLLMQSTSSEPDHRLKGKGLAGNTVKIGILIKPLELQMELPVYHNKDCCYTKLVKLY